MNGKPRESFYTLWTASILICLALCVGVLIYVSVVGGGPRDGAQKSTPEQDGEVLDQSASGEIQLSFTPEPSPTPAPTVLGQTADQGQAYIDQLIFLGDSTTYQMVGNGFVPFTQIWVPEIGFLNLFNWSIDKINYYPPDDPENPIPLSIEECAATAKPEYLVITLGADGVAVLNEAEFKQYYLGVIQAVQQASPDTKIICQSMFPVVDSLAPTGINNANIEKGNAWILDLAEQTGVRFLNTHEALLDESGGLVASYSPYDGIHLTADAYEVIFQYIRTHGYQ